MHRCALCILVHLMFRLRITAENRTIKLLCSILILTYCLSLIQADTQAQFSEVEAEVEKVRQQLMVRTSFT